MGCSIAWLAVKGKSPATVRDELGFRPSGDRESIPEAELSAVTMPNGWYLIVSNISERIGSDADLQRLSSSGGELVTGFVEEHVMVSKAAGWREGRIVWSIMHDAQKNKRHLEVQGMPPPEFVAIRDSLFAKQTPGCDYIFDIQVETARSLTGYRYDEDIAGLSGDVFEVLIDISPKEKKSSFFKKLFG